MEFNERLMELRKQNGMSQEELGFKLDVSRQTVSKWELGETTPEMSKLVAMSHIFNVSLDSLIKGENAYTRYEKGGYEYKTSMTLWGMPLVHVNTGGKSGRPRRAKGIVAVGDMATGIVAVGGLSIGIVSVGGMSVGVVTLGGLAIGLIAAGGLAIGAIAIGTIAIGLMAIGVVAMGINSAGFVAIAKDIAYGEVARAKVAIGYRASGAVTLDRDTVTPEAFRQAVNTYLPKAMDWVVRWFERIIMR